MNCTTNVVQVTNVSPSTTSEQMRMLFGFLGTIEELKLFPPDESPLPVTSRVCFVKFQESESVGVSQHLTNTVFVDRALIVVPFAEGVIPEEAKALSLLAPANAVAGIMSGGGLLPTPNPMSNPQMGGNPFGGPSMDAMAAFGFSNPNMNMNMNPQSFPTEQLLKFMTQVDPKMNHMGVGMNMNMNPGLKADSSNKEIEVAMKRVREAQSLISAHCISKTYFTSQINYRYRSKRRSHSRSRRRSKSPRRRSGRSHSKDRSKPSPSKSRDRKKEERDKKCTKTPPKSYSTTRRSRSIDRRRRKSRSASRSPKKSPKRKVSRTPSPRRHKKEKKRDKERQNDRDRERRCDKDRSREERKEKKERSKDKERDKKTDGEKGDMKMSLQVTRDYDEEEQGYDSEKERERLDKKDSDQDSGAQSPHSVEGNGTGTPKVNGDDHREEDIDHHEEDDMDVSD
uniref:RRM domain-containing protein n=1 Tax=Oncorhynchus tshawytscha TaxID=74940 RepID=A0A8C8BZW6_ONCTS